MNYLLPKIEYVEKLNPIILKYLSGPLNLLHFLKKYAHMKEIVCEHIIKQRNASIGFMIIVATLKCIV